MIRTPRSGPRISLIASETYLMESMSSPESVSSRIAISGCSAAIWRISARFFSPPLNPSLTYRERKEESIRSVFMESPSRLRNSRGVSTLPFVSSFPSTPRLALMAVRRKLAMVTPGTTVGYWRAR